MAMVSCSGGVISMPIHLVLSLMVIVAHFSLAMPPDMRPLQDCEPEQNSCDFYQCREGRHQCGDDGYYLGFGYKYCQEYIELTPTFKPETQRWMADVRLCLQEELAALSENRMCKDAMNFAFDSHSKCYMEAGVCSLPLSEFYQVLKVIKGNVLLPKIFFEGIEIMYYCAVINDELDEYMEIFSFQ